MRPRNWTVVLAALLFSSIPVISSAEEVIIPSNEYNILVHYDLGMHCTGFDFSYCCVLPPYNSVLAQIVKTARQAGETPKLLGKQDLESQNLLLWYTHENNTYSEGNKLLYWNVPWDVKGNGRLDDPVDSMANAEWRHLYIYAEAPLGFKLEGATRKLYLGKDINIPMDHGPTGKPVSNGHLDYTGETGTIVYTTLNDGKNEVPIALSQRDYWEALGLPLTPFFDSSATGSLRSRQEIALRPYQKAIVSLVRWRDTNGDKIAEPNEIETVKGANGAPVSFFGTNPIDSPSCEKCHGSGKAAGDEFHLWKKELAFWKDTFPDTSDYYAMLKAAGICMLEIHDKREGTAFLANYNPDAKTGALINRLGRTSVICQDCHADNVVGKLQSATNARTKKRISALTAAIHLKHLAKAPEPDINNRAADCQTCHPGHLQTGGMDRYPITTKGEYRGGDIRDWEGCYVQRDVHSNRHLRKDIKTRAHLNAVGKWLMANVANDGKGLYCTNCHNLGARLLFKGDRLTDVIKQSGDTLRNKSIEEIVATLQKMEGGRYAGYSASDFFDPKVAPKDRVSDNWTDPPSEPYNKVDDAGDYWLAAGEPHCADCHTPPFVEGMGGTYFPIDVAGKYSLMRYSKGHSKGKGHAGLSCQSCHESIHGLYPVNSGGPDPVSFAQAAQYNPAGSHGPLTCGSCHAVDKEGVPVGIVKEDQLKEFPDSEYPSRYEKAVALAHTQRLPAERYSFTAHAHNSEK